MAKKESWFSLPVRLSEEVDRLFDELIYRPWGFSRSEEAGVLVKRHHDGTAQD